MTRITFQSRTLKSRTLGGSRGDPELPFPEPPPMRLRNLTPRPSASSLFKDSPALTPESGLGLLELLPTELQEDILIRAFGNLIVHLELVAENDGQRQYRGFVCSRSPALGERPESAVDQRTTCAFRILPAYRVSPRCHPGSRTATTTGSGPWDSCCPADNRESVALQDLPWFGS